MILEIPVIFRDASGYEAKETLSLFIPDEDKVWDYNELEALIEDMKNEWFFAVAHDRYKATHDVDDAYFDNWANAYNEYLQGADLY